MIQLLVGFCRVDVCRVFILLALLLSGSCRVVSAQPMSSSSGQASQAVPADYASQILSPKWRASFPYRSAFGSLCSLGPLACALIDRPFALNAHLELIIRPKAFDGSTGVLLPFAMSVPLFGRAEVGLGSCYAGWWVSKEDVNPANADPQGNRPAGLCPFWLAAKLLVFPWFRDPHTNPALAIEYQFEYQAGPFHGLNHLGLPGPLSKVSLAYRHPIGRLELAAAVSVLIDHVTHSGTLQFGPHLGYRLPVGEHFWIFGQAMVQAPSWGPLVPGQEPVQTLNLAPPVAGTLAIGVQQRADFGVGAGFTLMLTKSDIETRVDLLFRLLSFEVGPHIKPLIAARNKPETPPKVAVALASTSVVGGGCPPGMQPVPASQSAPGVQTDGISHLAPAAPNCIPISPPSVRQRLPGTACYLYDVDGTQQLRMGFVDSTGEWCDWDGLHLPLGAVVPPARHEPPSGRPAVAVQKMSASGPEAGARIVYGRSGARSRTAAQQSAKPSPADAVVATAPSQIQPSGPVRRTGTTAPTQSVRATGLGAFEQGFVDGAESAVEHARQIYQAVKANGPLVVLPGPQEVKQWWRDKKEECLNHLGECIREEANQAREELNRWSQMSWSERRYQAGRLAFEAVVEVAVNAVLPGGGLAAGATKTVEHVAEKEIVKTVEKQAAKTAARKTVEQTAENEARRIAEAEAKRAAEAEARQIAEGSAKHEVQKRTAHEAESAATHYVPRDAEGNPFPLPRNTHGEFAPSSSAPHSQIGWREGRKSGYRQTREFGEHGKPVKDTDWTDHGRPRQHQSPHDHLWIDNPTGGTPRRSN